MRGRSLIIITALLLIFFSAPVPAAEEPKRVSIHTLEDKCKAECESVYGSIREDMRSDVIAMCKQGCHIFSLELWPHSYGPIQLGP